MHPLISKLLTLPNLSQTEEVRVWLGLLIPPLQHAAESTLRAVAEPLEEAQSLLGQSPPAGETVMALLLRAQGLGLFAYLQELRLVRNFLSAEVKKTGPTAPDAPKLASLLKVCEEVLEGLTALYNGFREGHLEVLRDAPALLNRAQANLGPLLKPPPSD